MTIKLTHGKTSWSRVRLQIGILAISGKHLKWGFKVKIKRIFGVQFNFFVGGLFLMYPLGFCVPTVFLRFAIATSENEIFLFMFYRIVRS
jgi:hypothetical protein